MSKEMIENIISYMAYERGHSAGEEEVEAIKKGMVADFKPVFERIEELERDLLNLVCRIHRDGGHYIAAHGEAKAIADADLVVAENNAKLDALQANNVRLNEQLAAAQVREDELVAHVERLREALEHSVLYVPDLATVPGISAALAATPKQSLARLRNQMREECAALCDKQTSTNELFMTTMWEISIAIRAMKEPE